MSVTAMAMRVGKANANLVPNHVEVVAPPRDRVRVDVIASGVCHADIGTAQARGAASFPVTPGHEIAGVVAELGDDVAGWMVGDRVAIGWFGGSCGRCRSCRTGDVVHCPDRMIPGLSYPGGWSESITVPAQAMARIPDGLDFADAAPMGCAGVTTFNAIRHSGVDAGGSIAVVGLGGLGHLAVQFAARMGYHVVAVARGPERESFARELGARRYIDGAATEPGAALKDLGGVDMVFSTMSSTAPLTGLISGLRERGRLVVVGADGGSIDIPSGALVSKALTVAGHLTGSAADIEATMRFAVNNAVRPVVRRMPLADVNDAVARVIGGGMRGRIVLDTGVDR